MALMPSDARLARRASDGDERAFAAIFRRYHQELYRFCLSSLGRPEDAQEALQNTMVKALRSLPGEEREIHLKPWLYRVAHNESIDLLRRRREGPDIETVQASAPTEIAQTVEMRARLSRLLADLGELPDRQRSALTMRELAGLSYEQIGETFGTSVAVARQTVYEARLGLRELEAGREMRCEEVTRQLSDADGRVLRRRDIQAHLRSCTDCRSFRDAIPRRRDDFAALAPLPALAALAILHGAGGGSAAVDGGLGGGTGAAAGVGAGAGKAAATSVALKAAATVAVVATVGVTAADRGGMVDLGLSDGNGSEPAQVEHSVGGTTSAGGSGETGTATGPSATSDEDGQAKAGLRDRSTSTGTPEVKPAPASSGHGSSPTSEAPPASPQATSAHGQEKAASHKGHGTDNRGQTNAAAHKAKGNGKRGQGHHHQPPKRGHETHGKGKGHEPPAHGKSTESSKGGGKTKESAQPPAEESQAPSPPGEITESPQAGTNGTAGEHGHKNSSP
jgi:RNA polymerase sigma factor (sigma-70 family)